MTRYLCYKHYGQEFDKLPNALRHKAVCWQTVDKTACEICNPVLGVLIRLENASVEFALRRGFDDGTFLERLIDTLEEARVIIAKAKEETQ